ncbi:MAG TPA: amidohydrolase family protein, partial [Saprospiraceae bacterium]|nr:amidohydrolase family protein [Saprospiraceae bacterium]
HMAQKFFDSYKSVYDSLGDLPKTMVPHAPYSVSKTLFRLLNETNAGKDSVTSIHNQETVDEDLLYQSGGGGFVGFWESFGFDMKHFQSTGEASVFYAMEHLDREHQVLFIHNTCMLEDHVRRTLQWNPRSFFVTCPNANLFIENHLPDYQNFLNAGAQLCIGTDSLSSNWHLSMLEEVKTILKYHSFLDLETVLGWATWNGASALKLDGLGAFQQGFTPGVNWIQSVRMDAGKCRLQPDARVRKIA